MAKETENRDLINGFNSIAAGQNIEKSSDSKSKSNDSSSVENPKLIGVFVGLLKDGDWFCSFIFIIIINCYNIIISVSLTTRVIR